MIQFFGGTNMDGNKTLTTQLDCRTYHELKRASHRLMKSMAKIAREAISDWLKQEAGKNAGTN